MVQKISFGDFWFNAFSLKSLNSLTDSSIQERKKIVIAHHNLHSICLALKDNQLKSFYDEVSYIHADGMPVVWLGKLMGYDLSSENRITYVDWINPLLEVLDSKKRRIFYLGSKDHVADSAVRIIKQKFPNVIIDFHSGYFDMQGSENQKILSQINDFKPDILFVGMGMPRQEHWIASNFEKIKTSVVLPCGACFDYVAGEIRTPPRWSGRLGLEWFFRFIYEPGRLLNRYFWEPITLLPFLFKILFKRTK